MLRRTYNNMLRATKMIADKGYNWQEANLIAMNCFDHMDSLKNGMHIEWYIEKIEVKTNDLSS